MQKRIAIVTGTSNPRGIGTAVCRRLAAVGVDLFFTYWRSDEHWINQLKEELQGFGVSAYGLEVDLSKPNSAMTIIGTCIEQLGYPSVLVNNAAYSTQDGYKKLDGPTLDDHYSVNVRTPILLCVEFAKHFEKSRLKNGRIINMISGQDLGPMVGELSYVATKGAMTAFSKTLSAELAPIGITVNAVNPGATDTTWMNDEIREQLLPKFLMGRIGQPEDAAKLIVFLASDDAEWITGQVINSEGGFLRR